MRAGSRRHDRLKLGLTATHLERHPLGFAAYVAGLTLLTPIESFEQRLEIGFDLVLVCGQKLFNHA